MKQESFALPRIETAWRLRQRWHRAEKSLILQAKAICRGHTEGDTVAANELFEQISAGAADADIGMTMALMPFLSAIANFNELRGKLEKELATLANQLPVADWIKSTPGIAIPSLAAIVGEAGDLAKYSTHSKLWKRMGVAPFTKDGRTKSGKQWKVEGGLTRDDWRAFGYKPSRRSVMFVIEDSMTKAKGPYREIYLARKEYLRTRAADRGLTVAPAAKIPEKRRAEFISLGHIDQDAKRYMGKRLLRDLWKAWRRAALELPEMAGVEASAAEPSKLIKGKGKRISAKDLPRNARSALALTPNGTNVRQLKVGGKMPPRMGLRRAFGLRAFQLGEGVEDNSAHVVK